MVGAMFIAQTLVEYGFLTSIAAGFAATRDRIEMYVGSGNLKYLLIVMLALLILLLAKRRRPD